MEILLMDPWKSVFLSWLFPGLGQYLAANKRTATLIVLGYGLSTVGIVVWGVSRNVDWRIPALLIGALCLTVLFNLIHAYRYTLKQNSVEFEIQRKENKSFWLACLIEQIFPGLGIAYASKKIGGIAIFIGMVFFSGFEFSNTAETVFRALIIIGTFLFLYRQFKDSLVLQKKEFKLIIFLLFSTIILIPVMMGSRHFLFNTSVVPTGSMSPLLKIKDRVIVMRNVHTFNRFDCLVYRFNGKEFVKRLAGFPGETLEYKNGHLLINNIPIKEPSDILFDKTNFGPIQLNKESYFFIGDNREKSLDSRFLGPVLKSDITGRVHKIYWPLSRIKLIK